MRSTELGCPICVLGVFGKLSTRRGAWVGSMMFGFTSTSNWRGFYNSLILVFMNYMPQLTKFKIFVNVEVESNKNKYIYFCVHSLTN
jgi:hypothetical protein